MKILVALTLLTFLPLISWSQEVINSNSETTPNSTSTLTSSAILLGHNVTPTTYTLKKGEFTAGNYALAYGITDAWTIGTSPWLDYSYNMPMINTRYLIFAANGFRMMADVSYFKTYDAGVGSYEQESAFARLTTSKKISDLYTIHVSGGYQYFWDDLRPYSLRLVPGNGSPYNLSATTLHEIHWFKKVGTFIEAGVLGLNYETPYLHLGASAFYQWKSGTAQLGISRSSSMGYVHYVSSTTNDNYVDTVYHPEIQFQWYF